MDLRRGAITIGELMADPKACSVLNKYFSPFLCPSLLQKTRGMPLSRAVELGRAFVPMQKIRQAMEELRCL